MTPSICWNVAPCAMVRRAAVSSIDFFPTIIDLTGSTGRMAEIDGTSILPALKGARMAPKPLFWHYPHYSNQGVEPGSAVRLGKYKLIDNFETGKQELYDLANWVISTAKSAGADGSRVAISAERSVEISYRDRKPENIKEASTRALGVELVEGQSLPFMTALLAGSACYFGSDSGISHLAGCLDVPGAIFFGPTDPLIWAPVGRNVRALVDRWSDAEALAWLMAVGASPAAVSLFLHRVLSPSQHDLLNRLLAYVAVVYHVNPLLAAALPAIAFLVAGAVFLRRFSDGVNF